MQKIKDIIFTIIFLQVILCSKNQPKNKTDNNYSDETI